MPETSGNNRDKTAETLILTSIGAKPMFNTVKIKIESNQIILAKDYFGEWYKRYVKIVKSGSIEYVKMFQGELIVIKKNKAGLFFKKLGLISRGLPVRGFICFDDLPPLKLRKKKQKSKKKGKAKKEVVEKQKPQMSIKDIVKIFNLFMVGEDASLSQKDQKDIEEICGGDVYSVVAEYMGASNKEEFISHLLS